MHNRGECMCADHVARLTLSVRYLAFGGQVGPPLGVSPLVDGVIVMEGWAGAHAAGATGSRSSGFVGSVFAGPDGS